MLKILRDNLKYLSWILWVVILIFIAFVFVDFGGGLSRGTGGRAAAATVGGEEISYTDFQREYRVLEGQYRQAFGENFTPELANQLRLPLQALDRLVDERLLLDEAESRGIQVSDDEVQEAILEIPGMKDAGGNFVGQPVYERFVRANGYTLRDFEQAMRRQIRLAKLNRIFSANVSVTDADVEKSYREQAERAAIRYVALAPSKLQAQAQVTPEEVAAYFDAHKEEFRLPVQRVVDYLLIDTVRTRAKMELSPEELQGYYDSHLDDYKQEEQVRARHILVKVDDKRSAAEAEAQISTLRQRIEKGEDFGTIARAVSDDPASKTRGGDLGFFGRGRMIKEFEDAAFEAQPNQLVGPLRTSFGYHLLEVLEHRTAGQRPFSEVEGQVRARLAAERADAAAEARANELVARIDQEKITGEEGLRALADNDVVTFLTTPPFGREDSVPGVGRGTPFSSAAYALEPGKHSTPVKIARGFAILSLKEERPSRLPELSEVEGRVRQSALRDKSEEMAVARLERERADLAAGRKSLDAVAKDLDLEVKEGGEFGRGGNVTGLGSAPEVVDAALAAKQGEIGGPVRSAQGVVLFEVTSRKSFDPVAFVSEKQATRESLERSEVNRLLASIVDQKKREKKVQYDRPLLEQFGLLGDESTGS
ncbi:MAG: SurA N-terminal domain-containing protein [Thermoanaerobaculia bacterium]